MKKTHIKTYIIVAILISIVGISIAYAALQQQLQIKTNASVQSSQTSWNIVITENYCSGRQNRSVPGSGTPRDVQGYKVEIKGTTVTVSNAIIRAPGDTFGCRFYIENKGEVDAKVQSITGPTITFSGTGSTADEDVSLVQSNISCQYGNWTDGQGGISIGNLLAAGAKREIEVGYCFSMDMPKLPTNPVTFSATYTINFEQA